MFKIIKNFNWIILSSFLCIFMGIVTFLTFINEGFVPLTDRNLQTLLIIDISLLLIFFACFDCAWFGWSGCVFWSSVGADVVYHSYGRYRGVLTDTGTACNHREI